MDQRLDMLARLMKVYSVVEEMHCAELQRRAAGVREAEQAMGAQVDGARMARLSGRVAVNAGDCVGRTQADTMRETAGVRWLRLSMIHKERETSRAAAQEQYLASRVEHEQMKRLVERLEVEREMEAERKAQSASDDRFLARLGRSRSRAELGVAKLRRS